MPEAHAPGKLVICGEYAVLQGAPAIAAAVDVRGRARVDAIAGSVAGASRLTLPEEGSWTFDWQRGMPHWRERPSGGRGRILEAVAEALKTRAVTMAAGLEIVLDTRAFQTTGGDGTACKLGLGSSAAITVALAVALLAQAGRANMDRESLFELCAAAHRRFQGGSGSGIDVAAAVHGGVVGLVATATGVNVRPLAWPQGLHWLAAWSGKSAATTAMLTRFEAFRSADRARFERHLRQLGDLAAATLVAWERGEVAMLLELLADHDDALRALDDGAGIGIYTPAHRQLAEVAGAAGALYKISGAGGGDFGIAFADSAEVIARLSKTLAEQGVRTLPGTGGAPGVLPGN